MDKKYSLSGIASNPASGINNLDLRQVGADGSQADMGGSEGVSIKEMVDVLDKFSNNEENMDNIKTDLEEIFPRVTREEYKKMISQLMNSIEYANDPKKRSNRRFGFGSNSRQKLWKKRMEWKGIFCN